MPVHHIVLLTFKDGLDADAKQSVIDSVVALKECIPEIKSISTGLNCNCAAETELARGHTHAFVMLFDNEADRDTYLYHPTHVEVATTVVIPALKEEGGIVVFDMKV